MDFLALLAEIEVDQNCNTLKEGILQYKENIIVNLNKSIQQITDQIKSIEAQKQSIQQLDQIMNKYSSLENFTIYLNHNQIQNRQFRNQIMIYLQLDLKQKIRNIDFEDLISNWSQQMIKQTQVPPKTLLEQVLLAKYKSSQNFKYEQSQQVESKQWIYDFAIDQRTNILIAGMQDGIIKIFDFQSSKVGTESQILKAHTNSVLRLYSRKNTPSFVSGSNDNSIIIWCFDQVNKWQAQQILNSHKKAVCCIQMNSNEDLLISGSYDNTVKFWRKLSDSWDLSQTADAGNIVYALSLNENEDKLIASTENYQIVVMIIQKNQEWKLAQKIQVNEFRQGLFFPIQDQFFFQPLPSDELKVYYYEQTQQQFYLKTSQSMMFDDNLFPCQYIKNLNILIAKHDQFVDIFKVNQNGKFQLIQSIEYQHNQIYGKMTDNGEYLITWDYGSKEIQVRKLKFQEKSN